MPREESLPIEFSELQGQVQYVVRRGTNEYSGSCPACHGTQHQDGSYPDRFRMFLVSTVTNKPLAWCRACGFKWWPGKDKKDWKPSTEQVLAWAKEREAAERERIAASMTAIELLQREMAWVRYHDNLTDEIREAYHKRGISDFFIDYLQLGYNPERWYSHGGENHVSPALTIPIWEPVTWNALGMKNRLLNPVDPGDKYRPEIKGLPAALYNPAPDFKLEGRVLVVEGEFKSIVTYACMDDVDTVVVGVPSKSPDPALLDTLAACEPVIFCLDPDAYTITPGQKTTAIERITGHVKERARVMRLPAKIDDLIVAGSLDKTLLRRLVDGARKA